MTSLCRQSQSWGQRSTLGSTAPNSCIAQQFLGFFWQTHYVKSCRIRRVSTDHFHQLHKPSQWSLLPGGLWGSHIQRPAVTLPEALGTALRQQERSGTQELVQGPPGFSQCNSSSKDLGHGSSHMAQKYWLMRTEPWIWYTGSLP